MRNELDAFDLRILKSLQIDSSIPTTELAEKVGLSQAPCWRRVQRLKKEGYIRSEVALLDRRKLGLNAQIFALVKMSAHGRSDISNFASSIKEFEEILDCYVIMGAFDFLLRIVTSNIESYERLFFKKLSKVPGVQEINSFAALSEIKSITALPLSSLGGA